MSNFETVHTMTDYYDGPRGGVADYHGVPHVYKSTGADIGDVPGGIIDVFRLSPIPPEVFKLALEAWTIWRRWETAIHLGETSADDTHTSLQIDRARHHELEHLLAGRLEIAEDCRIFAHAEFRIKECPEHSGTGFRALEVSWTPIVGE